MSYLALYRKYRPLTFGEMVGQEEITTILKNQIKNKKISHAYIFNGTRGTGKTTAAKIFVRAINCLNPKDGEPCNECENCKSILEGETTDVVELDAASNNSVENIRSIRQEVMYSTTNLKYRVYIIDEAHMLSTSAFNALLKTLEEPPENVIFILATTEEHKILPTIISRCVRFEFKKISEEKIKSRLIEVLQKDGIKYEEEALQYISNIADGGMRDALSILERCIDLEKNSIEYSKVLELIGNVNAEILTNIVDGILTYNVNSVNVYIEKTLKTGKNLRNITNQLLMTFIDILVENQSKDGSKKYSNVSKERLGYIIDKLSDLDEKLRQSNSASIIFKSVILGITLDNLDNNSDSLREEIKKMQLRIEKLENRESIKEQPQKQEREIEKHKLETKTEQDERKIEEKVNNKENLQMEFKDLNKVIKMVSDSDNLKLYSALTDVKGFQENNKIIFETKNSFAYSILRQEASERELKKIIKQITDNDTNIQINLINEQKDSKNDFESFMADSGMPFEIVD